MNKRAMLREAIARDGELSLAAGVHDGLGARIAQNSGFQVLWASGLGISASYAVPDESILTMTEFLNAARTMNDATDLPVLADCDTGFGGASNVARMVDQYERVGIAGVCIEDKVFPKRNSLGDGTQHQETIESFCNKIRVAKKAQRTPTSSSSRGSRRSSPGAPRTMRSGGPTPTSRRARTRCSSTPSRATGRRSWTSAAAGSAPTYR